MGFTQSCDNDGFEFSRASSPRARKQHCCDECRGTIRPGEDYRREDFKFEGEMYSVVVCGRCADLALSYAEQDYCWTTGELWQSHLERLEEEGKGDTRAADVARAELVAIAERKRALYPNLYGDAEVA